MGSQTSEPVLLHNYYRGRIVNLRPGRQTGVIKAVGSGRFIPFEWPFVQLIGADKFDALQVGMEVGFDVSWTSRGLRVSVIRVFGGENNEPAPTSAEAVERPGPERGEDSA